MWIFGDFREIVDFLFQEEFENLLVSLLSFIRFKIIKLSEVLEMNNAFKQLMCLFRHVSTRNFINEHLSFSF